MWLCEDKLKDKTAHFRLPSASQKRASLSSLRADLHGTIFVACGKRMTGLRHDFTIVAAF